MCKRVSSIYSVGCKDLSNVLFPIFAVVLVLTRHHSQDCNMTARADLCLDWLRIGRGENDLEAVQKIW